MGNTQYIPKGIQKANQNSQNSEKIESLNLCVCILDSTGSLFAWKSKTPSTFTPFFFLLQKNRSLAGSTRVEGGLKTYLSVKYSTEITKACIFVSFPIIWQKGIHLFYSQTSHKTGRMFLTCYADRWWRKSQVAIFWHEALIFKFICFSFLSSIHKAFYAYSWRWLVRSAA